MKKYLQIIFLVIGTLTVLEFIFIRGLFTWLMAVMSTMIIAALNIIVCIKDKEWLQACFYILLAVALCMGYFSV